MRKHAAANDDVRTHPTSAGIHKLATIAWKDCLAIGTVNGWRNAKPRYWPDGDHRLMMDCGHHRDRARPGAGQVQEARRRWFDADRQPDRSAGAGEARLPAEQAEAGVEYVGEHATSSNAPGLRRSTTRWSDCAMAKRSIAPTGHGLMMAAVQPFLFGGHLPEDPPTCRADYRQRTSRRTTSTRAGGLESRCWRSTPTPARSGKPLSAGKKAKPGTDNTAESGMLLLSTARCASGCRRSGRARRCRYRRRCRGAPTSGSYPTMASGRASSSWASRGRPWRCVMDAFSMSISVGLAEWASRWSSTSRRPNLRFQPAGDDGRPGRADHQRHGLPVRLALDDLPYEKREQLLAFRRRSGPPRWPSYGAAEVDLEELRLGVEHEHGPGRAGGNRPGAVEAHSSQLPPELHLGKAAELRAAVHDLRKRVTGRVVLPV